MAPERRSMTAAPAVQRRCTRAKATADASPSPRSATTAAAAAAASSAPAAAVPAPLATPLQLSLLPLRAAGWSLIGSPLPGALWRGEVVVQLTPLLHRLEYTRPGGAVSKYDSALLKWVEEPGCPYDDVAACKAVLSPRLRLDAESHRDARFVSKMGFKWLVKVLHEWEPKKEVLAFVADARRRRRIRDALFTLPSPAAAAASVAAAAAAAAAVSPRPSKPLSRSGSNSSSSSHNSSHAEEESKEGPASLLYPPGRVQRFLPVQPPSRTAASAGAPAHSSEAVFAASSAAHASAAAAAVSSLPPIAAALSFHYTAETMAMNPQLVPEVERIVDYLQSLLPHAAPPAPASAPVPALLDLAPILPPLEPYPSFSSIAVAPAPAPVSADTVAARSASLLFSSSSSAAATAAASAAASSAPPSRVCSSKRPSRPSDTLVHAAPPPPKRARLLLPSNPAPLSTFEAGQGWRGIKPSRRIYVVQPSPLQRHEELLPATDSTPTHTVSAVADARDQLRGADSMLWQSDVATYA